MKVFGIKSFLNAVKLIYCREARFFELLLNFRYLAATKIYSEMKDMYNLYFAFGLCSANSFLISSYKATSGACEFKCM